MKSVIKSAALVLAVAGMSTAPVFVPQAQAQQAIIQVTSLEELIAQCNADPAICATLIASYGAALVAAGASVEQLTALSNFAVDFSNGAGAAYRSAIAGAIIAVATQAANNPAYIGLASQMVAAATTIDPNADVGTVGQAPASPT
ncbi:hypothetical protein [Marivivens aquimaris]|uniref:hypothetical protein n=1 Tax=Marivivens aquimaris TaxID=2774876 RepID=UPI0018800BBB|nr:hypothetical protein [Marivivens aquimaris]